MKHCHFINNFLEKNTLQVCNSLTETTSSKCYLCGASPKEMNKINDCMKKHVEESKYQFGLSPLHSRIRFFEYFIHLSYRLDFKKWQARSPEEKEALTIKKRSIQKEFRLKLGLIIDKPRSGGSGTSNDGNTSRKFFANSDISAEITGLRKELIDRCGVVLQCLTSGCNIRTNEFQKYALHTAELLIEEYPWYYMPPSVHKVLIHGAQVIEHALVSIGELSEEAAEANNKHIRDFRKNNTRKMSRTTTNTDLLNRLLLQSDPLITNLRKIPRKQETVFSPEAQLLLES